MKLDYDRDADVLYITFAPSSSRAAARYVEISEGVVIRAAKRTGRVLSCTVAFFSKRSERGPVQIPELTEIAMNAALKAALAGPDGHAAA